jgi:hypothetical protein
MITPIVTKNLGVNQETGLEEVLKVWSVYIDAESELILVGYKIYILGTTGVEVKESHKIEYSRYNHPNNMSFDMWRNSPLGQGITQAIYLTLENYPILEQNIEPPVEG